MTVPTEFFGGNSDGGMYMEDWLDEMCKGCRHGRLQAGLRGMGCDLPGRAWAFPHDDLPEWVEDDEAPFGLRCTKKTVRKRGRRRRVGRSQLPLFEVHP